jgi:hypothetical protein
MGCGLPIVEERATIEAATAPLDFFLVAAFVVLFARMITRLNAVTLPLLSAILISL